MLKTHERAITHRNIIFGLIILTAFGCGKNDPPTLTTTEVSRITHTTAVSGGLVTSNAGNEIISQGVCWSKAKNPTVADNLTHNCLDSLEYESYLTGLTPNTTYYVRAYATSSEGTGYGNKQEFTTLDQNHKVKDIDGNTYRTVTIGSQDWLAENLKVGRYNNGDKIPTLLNYAELANASHGARTVNTPNQSDVETILSAYGALYNWHAVFDTRGLCPDGWSVPSDDEWKELVDFVYGQLDQIFGESRNRGVGNALKSCRNEGPFLGDSCTTNEHPFWIFDFYTKSDTQKPIHTIEPSMKSNTVKLYIGDNGGFTDDHNWPQYYGIDYYGFSALPGGRMLSGIGFSQGLGYIGYWWSSTEDKNDKIWSNVMSYTNPHVNRESISKNDGGLLSVRCIRD